MSVELISVLIAMLAVGAALGGLILTSNRGSLPDMRQDMARLESRVDERISVLESRLREDMGRLESRLREDMKQLSERVARMEHGQAKLEGLLEGLREAITGRARAS